MEPVVTQEDSAGDLYEVLFLLVLSWVATSFASFILGWVCANRIHSIRQGQPVRPPALRRGWHRLVSKALFFIARRRRIALAFNNLGNSSLRNGENSRPNTARRNQRRNHTPGRILNEGPAIDRSHGSNRGRAHRD